ncbi:hypothetical protein DSO57_1018734 [Entomophthora muscae]|uniref:Uncharacterized protein n=1 Tax=Entomophthora muscae TaxID=34485 RepID=A0ACC2S675_9FUNG|nr:hypothetical protein DSO57_1018734 [Entomophthora muscae]
MVLNSNSARREKSESLKKKSECITQIIISDLSSRKLDMEVQIQQLEFRQYRRFNQARLNKENIDFVNAGKVVYIGFPLSLRDVKLRNCHTCILKGTKLENLTLKKISSNFPCLTELHLSGTFDHQASSQEVKVPFLEVFSIKSKLPLSFWEEMLSFCPLLKQVKAKLLLKDCLHLKNSFPHVKFVLA